MITPEKNLPRQEKGNKTDVAESKECKSEQEAEQVYNSAKQRFLDVNRWEQIAGLGSAAFQIFDNEGREVDRNVLEDDYIRIDVPGPGPMEGNGYDWVKIEQIKDERYDDSNDEYIYMRVRPSSPPNSNGPIAHFFSGEATSNFILKREKALVSAAVHGRNEQPNTFTEKVVDKARNTILAAGALAGISSLQWTKLLKGWLEIF